MSHPLEIRVYKEHALACSGIDGRYYVRSILYLGIDSLAILFNMYGTMSKRRSYNGSGRRGYRRPMHTRTKAPVRRRRQMACAPLPRLRGNTYSNSNLQEVSFRRWTTDSQHSLTQSATGTGAELFFGGFFKLSDVVVPADFTSLFDQYKITGVQYVYYPDITENDWGVTGNGNVRPALYASFDPDDADSTTLEQIRQRSDCRRLDAFRKQTFWIKCRPTVAVNFRQDAMVQVNGGPYNGWIDLVNTNVAHFGLKLVMSIPPSSSTQPFKWRVTARYYFKCKGVR